MPATAINNIQEISRVQFNLLVMMLGALQEIAKCEVSQQGATAMKHIAEKSLINVHSIANGESLEETQNA